MLRVPKCKYWPYGYLQYRGSAQAPGFIVCAWNGAFHVQKRLSLQFLGATRKVTFGSLWVDCSTLLSHGIPHKVYGAAGVMSDKAAVMRLSMPCLQKSCLAMGLHVAAFLSALQASFTTASSAFSKRQQCLNAFASFYLLALHVCFNQLKYGSRWQQFSLSSQTIRNCCTLAAHAVTGSLTQIDAAMTQEIGIERYFSSLKRPYRGAPSVRDAVQGTARCVLEQMRRLRGVTTEQLESAAAPAPEPLTPDEVSKCSAQACAAAMQFFAFISVDLSVHEVVAEFAKWYRQ